MVGIATPLCFPPEKQLPAFSFEDYGAPLRELESALRETAKSARSVQGMMVRQEWSSDRKTPADGTTIKSYRVIRSEGVSPNT
jgi:hypothetical protein